MTRHRWIQLLLALNLVSLLPLAIWPLVSPRGFYDNFPGGSYHWIDINGPFNEHFLRDFGALNAALVVVIVFALWKPTVSLLQATGLAIAVYALPHAIYHLSHLDVYKSSEKFVATAPLVLQIFMGAAIVYLATERGVGGMTALRNLVRLFGVLRRAREHRFDLLRLLALRPALLVGTGAAELAGLLSNRVAPRLKLLAEFRVASIVGCEFCMDIGAALAEYDRIDPRQVREINDFETSDAFSDDERLVLRFATALSDRAPTVSSELRTEMAQRFTRAQLVELAAAIAHEHERSRFYVGVDLPPARFASDTACRLPRAV